MCRHAAQQHAAPSQGDRRSAVRARVPRPGKSVFHTVVPMVGVGLFISTPPIPPETSSLSHADECEDHPQFITLHSHTVTGPPPHTHTHTQNQACTRAPCHGASGHTKSRHTHARTSHKLIWRTNYRGCEKRGERRQQDGGLESENVREHGQWRPGGGRREGFEERKCRGMKRNEMQLQDERMEEWEKQSGREKNGESAEGKQAIFSLND